MPWRESNEASAKGFGAAAEPSDFTVLAAAPGALAAVLGGVAGDCALVTAA